MNALSNCGLLSRFVGMVTDSRSFMSYPRHEYFRRVLCNLIGTEIERGELPDSEELVGGMIRRICYQNAAEYLSLPMAEKAAAAISRMVTGCRPAGLRAHTPGRWKRALSMTVLSKPVALADVAILVHPDDNVAVVRRQIAAGVAVTTFSWAGSGGGFPD